MIRGFDIYDGQGEPDFDAAFAAGWSFAIFKATQGTRNVQDTFARNRQAAAAAGFGPIGCYHFAQDGDPEPQADHFADVVGELGPDEFAVLDLEWNPTYFTLPMSQWADFEARWWGRVIARLGPLDPRRCVDYMSEWPAGQMPASMAARSLWVAGYPGGPAPTEWADWQVGPWSTPIAWQYTSTGRVPGIGDGQVNVDCNIAPDDLRARLGLVATPHPTQQEDDDMLRYIFAGQDWVFPGPGRGPVLPTSTDGQLAALNLAGVPAIGEVDADAHAFFQALAIGR